MQLGAELRRLPGRMDLVHLGWLVLRARAGAAAVAAVVVAPVAALAVTGEVGGIEGMLRRLLLATGLGWEMDS